MVPFGGALEAEMKQQLRQPDNTFSFKYSLILSKLDENDVEEISKLRRRNFEYSVSKLESDWGLVFEGSAGKKSTIHINDDAKFKNKLKECNSLFIAYYATTPKHALYSKHIKEKTYYTPQQVNRVYKEKPDKQNQYLFTYI
jgi:hypothetical protein